MDSRLSSGLSFWLNLPGWLLLVAQGLGIGTLAQESVLTQDVPVVQAIVVLAAAAFVVVNLVVDLLYPLLDPRITTTAKVS